MVTRAQPRDQSVEAAPPGPWSCARTEALEVGVCVASSAGRAIGARAEALRRSTATRGFGVRDCAKGRPRSKPSRWCPYASISRVIFLGEHVPPPRSTSSRRRHPASFEHLLLRGGHVPPTEDPLQLVEPLGDQRRVFPTHVGQGAPPRRRRFSRDGDTRRSFRATISLDRGDARGESPRYCPRRRASHPAADARGTRHARVETVSRSTLPRRRCRFALGEPDVPNASFSPARSLSASR